MKEYIVIDTFEQGKGYNRWVGGMPITGEIIRCINCKHKYDCMVISLPGKPVYDPDGFCAWAEEE